MSFFNTMNTSASGLTAQSVRMDTIAQNIANADTTRTATGDPYRRSMVIFEERTADFQTTFMSMLRPAAIREEISNNITNSIAPTSNAAVANNRNTQGISSSAGQMFLSSNGVRVRNIISDQTPGPRTFEPSHPDADEEGYVTRPN
ncbi:MAG: flagellar basal body protein, partial [Defluviitaleaceae bacterium]|nr:flagellar basal body protein [Defluviitaleaceae bacterium]